MPIPRAPRKSAIGRTVQDPDPRDDAPGPDAAAPPLLDVRGLKIAFDTLAGDTLDGDGAQPLEVVRGLDLQLRRGESVGLVGPSGCGKTLSALAIVGLLPAGARRVAGRVAIDGVELPTASGAHGWRALRGRKLAMVYQEPAAALNPVLRVGTQIAEVLRRPDLPGPRLGRAEARRQGLEWLRRVSLPDPQRRWRSYPHELSGGQQQRVVLAMALAAGADLLIADEPTTALDVTVQAQILALLDRLRRELGLTLLLITHDLAVVAQVCQRVAIMDAGRVVESGRVEQVFSAPRQPMTCELLAAAGGYGD